MRALSSVFNIRVNELSVDVFHHNLKPVETTTCSESNHSDKAERAVFSVERALLGRRDRFRQRFRSIEGDDRRRFLPSRRRIIVTVDDEFSERCLSDMSVFKYTGLTREFNIPIEGFLATPKKKRDTKGRKAEDNQGGFGMVNCKI